MKKIKNILVATDFSVTSRNAYHYAKRLAITLGATITVVHIKEYFMPDSAMDALAVPDFEVEHLAEDAMTHFVMEEDERDGWVMAKHNVNTKIIKGDCVDSLVTLSESGDADLIVMGTTGLQDFLSKIIGTTSLAVANKAHCPVILVPREAKWHKIEKIMYASNYDSSAPKMLQAVTNFALSVHSAIHFVHVEDYGLDSGNNVNEVLRDELFLLNNEKLVYEIHSIYNIDKVEALNTYVKVNNIDLMSFVSKHRSFWRNLMHKSVTGNIAFSTETPMMVMHLDDELIDVS
jgi:nucleotide-binding universal stress UspA family protein